MLATLTTLKTRLGIALSETGADPLLTGFLEQVSARMELYCNRRFARVEHGWEEFPGEQSELRLERYPLETIHSLELKLSEATGWQAVPLPDCIVRGGCLISLGVAAGPRGSVVRLEHTGGHVLPGQLVEPGQVALPVELELACVEQAAYLHQNRERVGLTSFAGLRSDYERYFGVSAGGETPAQAQDVRMFWQFNHQDLLPGVLAILNRHRRLAG
jgi:hypothetical protein